MVLFNHEIFSAFNTHTPPHSTDTHTHTPLYVVSVRVRVLRQKFLLLAAQNKQNQTERNKVYKYLPMYTLNYIQSPARMYRYICVCVCMVSW